MIRHVQLLTGGSQLGSTKQFGQACPHTQCFYSHPQ
uniref:Uncharacterized protein n=1 Tax=Anguilla anguilla TaxID=7936 RepID=A0A0E9PHK3_ANGAN